ncbi:MAG: winged helix-turn-helix transcriptional regulator [Chromatiaceae bacterium]|nr:winged helix-turn-helix transcriptional regulator [Chromatiaceae bacterium]
MSIEAIHDTLERLCNLLRVEAREAGAAEGLLPIQLEALHYLAQCNRYSDTLQGVSDFLGQTKGTVSKTLGVLESRQLIERHSDTEDRRVVHLKVTRAARRVLAKAIPARFLVQSLADAGTSRIDEITGLLREVLLDAQRARGSKSFGACRTCRFNQVKNAGHRCGLTGEALSHTDIGLICREHEYPAA